MHGKQLWLAVLCFLGLGMLVGQAEAAPTPAQAAKLREADGALTKGGAAFLSKKFDEAAQHVANAEGIVAQLEADPAAKSITKNIEQLSKRVEKARALLELEGIKIPEPMVTGGPGSVSFAKQVAPLLVGKCGRCHVNESRGGFGMATFDALMKGTQDGVVVMPGKGSGSRIVEVIESGDMPRGGGTVTPDELAMLTKWIDEGASFDGPDRLAPLARLTPGAAPAAPAMEVQVTQATGKETVSFAADIGPVLLANCTGCHGEQNPGNGLRLSQFSAMLRGGESGAPLVPGKPEMSLLIQKLKGTNSPRMPLNRPALPDETIAKFEKWIAEGAKFDGPNPNSPLSDVVAYVFAKRSTHEELTARREEIAAGKWRLAIPDAEPRRVETKNFLILGNADEDTLEQIGQAAEQQAASLARLLRANPSEPLVKGRVTLYVFPQRFDYSEFARMVEKRDIPDHWRGHWGYDVVDAYGGINPPRDNEYSLPALLAQQITGPYVASLGRVPEWFSEGAARAMAARVGAKDPRVKQWDDAVPAALSTLAASKKLDSFMSGGLPPEESAILSYSYVKYLMGETAKFNNLLAALRQEQPFEAAFARAYGGTPVQVAPRWLSKAARGR